MINKQSQDPFAHCRRKLITERYVHCLDFILKHKIRGCEKDVHIAEAIGVVKQTISRMRSKSQDATIEQIAITCDYFNLSERYIHRGIGEPGELYDFGKIEALDKRVSALEKKLK